MSAGATVQRYTVSYGMKGHVEYIIKVDYNGREWAVRKRYSEFDHFNTKITKSGYIIPVKLPPRLYFGNLSEEQIIKRVKELDLYLGSLVRTVPADNSLLKEFLEVDSNMLAIEINRKPTLLQLSAADRAREVLRIAESSFIHIDAYRRLLHCGDVYPPRMRHFRHTKRKQRRHNPTRSFASSTGSHDSKVVSTTSSSHINPSDVRILRSVIRDHYLEQANDSWPQTPSSSSGLSPDISFKQPTTIGTAADPPFLNLPPPLDTSSDPLPTAFVAAPLPSIYDEVERRSNDIFLEQRHVMCMLTAPIPAAPLRQMDFIVQVIDRISLSASIVKVPLSDIVTDISPPDHTDNDDGEAPSAALALVDVHRRALRKKNEGKATARIVPSQAILRLRRTVAESGGQQLPGTSTGGTSPRKQGY